MSRKLQGRLKHIWRRQNFVALGIVLLSVFVYVWVSHQAHANPLTTQGLKQIISHYGLLSIFTYIAVIALSVVISPIPGAPLAITAGMVWGTVPAGIYSVIGGFLGSLIAYFVGHTLGRSAIKALTGKSIYFSNVRGVWFMGGLIFVTRLLPVLSFDLISYGAGVSGLPLPIYASATLLGMIPSTFLLTYMGQSFMVGLPLAIGLSVVFVVLLIFLPWGIHRHNWFGLRDMIHVD
jgi:uncharacterized membrane protein YdjX (TVP38/TMEM64 family)